MNKEDNLALFIAYLLLPHENGLSLGAIYKEVERRWEIPSDWHKQIPLGKAYTELKKMHLNWKNITSEHLQSLVNTEPKWKNEVRQTKRKLIKKGWLEKGSQWRGQWCLNNKGRYEAETELYF